jgi:hypothetical protein
MQVFEKLTAMLKVMERKTGKELDKDVNRVNELIKVSCKFKGSYILLKAFLLLLLFCRQFG